MSKKLKLGVVGIGNIFKWAHAKPLLAHPDVEIVALCDILPERAEAFAKEHGIKHTFKDFADLIALKDLDAVDICTPNLFHSQVAVAALKAGKHVFTEKPDAVSVEEAQKMHDAAKKSGKILMAMRNNRFEPASQFLKKYIDAGHMGQVYAARCGWLRRRGAPGRGGWFTTKALSGGGPLIDLGVHFIDLTLWFRGNPRPVAVSGATYAKFTKDDAPTDSSHVGFGETKSGGTFDVEDLAMGFIRLENGASLQIEFSWCSNIEGESTFSELRGEKAGARLGSPVNANGMSVSIFSEIAGTLVDIHPKLSPAAPAHGQHLAHFVDCVLGRAQPINTPTHGLDMIKILSAIYTSAKTGKEVTL